GEPDRLSEFTAVAVGSGHLGGVGARPRSDGISVRHRWELDCPTLPEVRRFCEAVYGSVYSQPLARAPPSPGCVCSDCFGFLPSKLTSTRASEVPARKLEVSHVCPCLRSSRVTTRSEIASGAVPTLSASCQSCAFCAQSRHCGEFTPSSSWWSSDSPLTVYGSLREAPSNSRVSTPGSEAS